MGIDNVQRTRLYSTLVPVLGPESAEVIMNSLNFEGTEELVSKDDLHSEFERMIAQIDKKFLNMKIWFLVTGAGIALAVVNLYKR